MACYLEFEIISHFKLAEALKSFKKILNAEKRGLKHGKYGGNELQLPVSFLIGKKGIIQFVHYGRDAEDVPKIDKMVAMI